MNISAPFIQRPIATTLLTIADLSRVWVLAEVPEASIPFVHVGTPARLDFPASGRAPFTARVDFVYPTLTGTNVPRARRGPRRRRGVRWCSRRSFAVSAAIISSMCSRMIVSSSALLQEKSA